MLFETKKSARIAPKLQPKAVLVLDALNRAKRPGDMNIPGFDFHPLQGFNPTRYSVHINGPWCVTFEFDGEHATRSISNNITEVARAAPF